MRLCVCVAVGLVVWVCGAAHLAAGGLEVREKPSVQHQAATQNRKGTMLSRPNTVEPAPLPSPPLPSPPQPSIFPPTHHAGSHAWCIRSLPSGTPIIGTFPTR